MAIYASSHCQMYTHVVDYVLHPQLKFWCRLRSAKPLATVVLPSLVHVLGTIFQQICAYPGHFLLSKHT